MALIKCPECGKEISPNATACPNCGQPIRTPQTSSQKPKKKHGCLTAIITVMVFFGVIGAVIIGTVGQNDLIQKNISGVSDKSEYITKAEYNSIQTGMSYEEVKKIVGSAGEITSQVEMNGTKIIMVTWYGNGTAGSNANVTFTNDAVTGKAQVGLK